MPTTLDEAAYGAGQLAAFFQIMALQQVLIRLAKKGSRFDRDTTRKFRQRFYALLERDLKNVEDGLYPRELLFQMPVRQYLETVPEFMRDLPKLVRQSMGAEETELEEELQLDRYPAYYHRHFPWEEGGYLSERTARLYDMTVELLFAGAADVMRRQVIAPVLRYFGVDISASFIREARQNLADVPDVSLVVENAEHLPFRDGYFDVATSCFLFHELPGAARRSAIAELFRVLKPGGLLVLEDSAQHGDGEEATSFLQSFTDYLHQRSFQHYLDDDLGALVKAAGFDLESVEVHWVARVVVARKPRAAAAKDD